MDVRDDAVRVHSTGPDTNRIEEGLSCLFDDEVSPMTELRVIVVCCAAIVLDHLFCNVFHMGLEGRERDVRMTCAMESFFTDEWHHTNINALRNMDIAMNIAKICDKDN